MWIEPKEWEELLTRTASLRLTVKASIVPMIKKWLNKGKGTKKWCKILVIAERKMSLSWVAKSLYTFMIERIK